MGRRSGLISVLLLVVAVLGACDRPPEEVEQQRELLQVPTRAQEVQARKEATRLYDDKGALEPSDEVVSGLRMPRGIKIELQSERRRIYDTTVPLEKLRAYFGPLLDTGKVSPGGGAVTFTHARARDSSGEIFFDVLIGAKPGQSGHNFVDIREYPAVPVQWPSDQEVRRQLAEAARRGE